VRESAVTVKSLDSFPAMIAARVCGGVNASGVRSRMCRSTFPSRSAISANDRTRPDARSSIQERAFGRLPRDQCNQFFPRWLAWRLRIHESLNRNEIPLSRKNSGSTVKKRLPYLDKISNIFG
jgi:hypothetical protein